MLVMSRGESRVVFLYIQELSQDRTLMRWKTCLRPRKISPLFSARLEALLDA